MVKWENYIGSDDEILSGKPTVKGTRLSVEFIMERLANGWSELDVLENYPSLSRESLQAVYAFTYEVVKESMLFTLEEKRA